MMNDLFVEGIGSIQLRGGVVRIDLLRQAPMAGEEDSQTVRLEPSGRLVMGPDTFLRTAAAFTQVIEKMREAGLVTMNPAPAAVAQPQASAPAAVQAPKAGAADPAKAKKP